MRKRQQKFSELPNGCDNAEYYGLSVGQVVNVKSKEFTGKAKITGTPPQGHGIYASAFPSGKFLWLSGESIQEATEPSDG